MQRISDTQVGNTPLIHISGRVYAKAEFLNPSGSIKDRMATAIVNNAERKGLLKKGDTIIEATSGNAGIAFAWLAAERGYNIKIVMPRNMSEERKQMLRFYGAELIEVEDGDFAGAIELRDELAEKNEWFNTNQFANELNVQAHENGTALEIIRQVEGIGLAAIVAGTGTGGTLMGCHNKLNNKFYFPNMKIVAVEPAESPVMSGGEAGLHGIQGIGDGSKFLVDLDVVDEIICISTEDACERAKQLAKEKGLFVGISAGANVLAAEQWAQKNPQEEGLVVTFLCDRGERYLSCL